MSDIEGTVTRIRVLIYIAVFGAIALVGGWLIFNSDSAKPHYQYPHEKLTPEQEKRMAEEEKMRRKNLEQTQPILDKLVSQWNKISTVPIELSGVASKASSHQQPHSSDKTTNPLNHKWLNPPLPVESKTTEFKGKFDFTHKGTKYPVEFKTKVESNMKIKSKLLFYFDSYAGKLLSCVLPIMETDVNYAETHFLPNSQLDWMKSLSKEEKTHLDNRVKSTIRPDVEKMTAQNEADYLKKLAQDVENVFNEARKESRSADILLNFQSVPK